MGTQLREPFRAFSRGQRWSRTGHAQCASPHIFPMPGSLHLFWGLVCGWTSLSFSMPSRKRTSLSFFGLAVRPSRPSAWKSYRGRSIWGHLNRWGLRWGFLTFGRKGLGRVFSGLNINNIVYAVSTLLALSPFVQAPKQVDLFWILKIKCVFSKPIYQVRPRNAIRMNGCKLPNSGFQNLLDSHLNGWLNSHRMFGA